MSFPVLKREEKTDLSVKIDVDSGNPYRDPTTGKFSFGIPGVEFRSGQDLFKNLPKATKDAATQRILASGANIVGIKNLGDKISIVALKDGRFLDKFTVKIDKPVKQGEKEKSQEPEKKSLEQLGATERDAIIDAARNLDLTGNKLKQWLEERLNITVEPETLQYFEELVDYQRIEDLINYLHTNMLRRSDPAQNDKLVRIRTPRGYLRKTFSRLSEDQAREVLERLRAKGWNESEVQDQVVESMPKRLKEVILEPFKINEEEERKKYEEELRARKR